jgi:hypothetical protein
MEQVIPGADPENFDSDPIIEAAECSDVGDHAGARTILMNLLAQDVRCLDAHAHLGNHEFDYRPEQALRHYETGTAIGELSVGPRFRDALPWGPGRDQPSACRHRCARLLRNAEHRSDRRSPPRIKGVGSVRLPVSAAAARKLCAAARPARHGFKDQTRLDRRRPPSTRCQMALE